jgi:tetratricopeptide (TPR) repeat protein
MRQKFRISPDRALLAGLFFTAVVYCRDLQDNFILDDNFLIFWNRNLELWRNWKLFFVTDVFTASTPNIPVGPVAAQHYRPVYMLWLMLNEHLFGLIVPWWHLTSLLLHICSIYLVYQLGLKILKDGWAAVLGALLFAFHPIHVESVAYLSASTDLLVTVFVLISFLSYCRFREPGGSPIYLAVSLFTAALAMLSKEPGAMLPFLLVAFEALHETADGQRWTRFLWSLPFFAIVASYAIVRTVLFGRNLGPGPGFSRWAAIADAPLVLLAYLRNLLWPQQLSFYYPGEWISRWTIGKSFFLVFVVLIAVFLWKYYEGQRGVRLQLLWTAILFGPALAAVVTFVKEDWMHDRHMYLVSVPFCLIVASGLTNLKFHRYTPIVCSFILVFLFCETGIQVTRFTDEKRLYENAVKVAPQNVLAHRYYAYALWGAGNYEGALQEFRKTLEFTPRDPFVRTSYADGLAEAGHDEAAATEYEIALRWSHDPAHRAFLLYRIAAFEINHSQFAESATHLREALQLTPQKLGYHAMLAEALRQLGQVREADQEMRSEVSLQKLSVHERMAMR